MSAITAIFSSWPAAAQSRCTSISLSQANQIRVGMAMGQVVSLLGFTPCPKVKVKAPELHYFVPERGKNLLVRFDSKNIVVNVSFGGEG